LLNIFKQLFNTIENEVIIKTILDILIKFSEVVGIGIFSYCAKLNEISWIIIAMVTIVVMVFAFHTTQANR